jgi:hypothetical protein
MIDFMWRGVQGGIGGVLGVLLIVGIANLYSKIKKASRSVPYRDYGRKVFIVSKDRPRLYAPFVWVHSGPTGGPVLRDESSWRTVSGCQLRIGRYTFWLQFRRFYKS